MTGILISEFQKLKDQFDRAKKILLIVHKKPDGDTLGSGCAIAGYLKKRQIDFAIFCASPMPEDFEFLPFSEYLTNSAEVWKEPFDLIAVFDSSNLKYAGAEEAARLDPKPFLINIDHHASNSRFGDLNIIDVSAASATEIIYAFFRDLHIPLDADIATCLLNGMITDTTTFHTANTTASVIEAASRLLAHGAKFKDISRHIVFNKKFSTLKLWGKALSRLFMNNPWNIAITVITQDDLKELKIDNEEGFSGLATFLNALDARAVLVLTEQKDGTLKGSLRTTRDDVDVMALAGIFGGGGHKKAAGFTVKGKLAQTENGFRIA